MKHKKQESQGVSAEGTLAKALGLESTPQTQKSSRRPATENGGECEEEK